MPKRPDGRIEPGQRLSTAISARAWNRAQDAADIVLGERTGFGAEGKESFVLPSVRVKLRDRGWFGQVRVATFALRSSFSVTPTIPPSPDSSAIAPIDDFSDTEKAMFNFVLPNTNLTRQGSPVGIGESGLFVCVGNNSNEFASAGFAFCRIRVFNYLHRYARVSPFPAFNGETTGQLSDSAGSLDSAFWGPAKIVGYVEPGAGLSSLTMAHNNTIQLTFPNFEWRWALIQF